MVLSNDGFYIPIIKEELCNKCEICETVCPILNPPGSKNYTSPEAYGAWSQDKEVRMASSSGGVFSEIARYVLQNGGTVYGAAFDYEKLFVKHIRIEKMEELEHLRGSKYVPSFVGESYKKALEDIKSGRMVLFSGTPCQIASIKNFLKAKLKKDVEEEENFITVDLVCHGVPSLRIFKLYLDHISKGKKIKKINFRDKETGWENFQIKVVFEGSVYKQIHRKDPFFRAFLWNLCLNKPCYDCNFSRIPRQGDITLGDLWGVQKTLSDKMGISLVLLNNKKGQKIFKSLTNLSAKEIPLGSYAKHNPRIVSGKFETPKEREKILRAKKFQEISLILLQYGIKAKIRMLIEKLIKLINISK